MKKLLCTVLTLMLLTSCFAVSASAITAVADEDDFQPVGEVDITWDESVSEKISLDGDMSDWVNAGYSPVRIEPHNMTSWIGNKDGQLDPGMPKNWSITTYFVCDATSLYIGFFTTDDTFVYATNPNNYNGDAFQFALDFGGLMKQMLTEDPDSLPDAANIFYSFACVADGAPLVFVRQNALNDGPLTEESGDGVRGAAAKTDEGWAAEFAFDWQMLYDDYAWKTWATNATVAVGPMQDLVISSSLYYISRNETNGSPTWAAGTSLTTDASWGPVGNGMDLTLKYVPGMHFDCPNILVLGEGETRPADTYVAETEAPTEPGTESPTEAVTGTVTESVSEIVTDASDTGAAAATDAGTSGQSGCSSALSVLPMTLLCAIGVCFGKRRKSCKPQ